ncbi:Mitochondrial uncoupling protein 2 [Vitis vinifera]|uniref:Mitochondrial uncoupling protein 2 n=1 Tax=Vitis vinifera TaxID=29760 RepID=A0A438F9K5_VITVI|nr:Mitochondrial uncoupling protein 2 [Vitis vinifera]
MSDLKHATEISFAGTFACSAFSACFAEEKCPIADLAVYRHCLMLILLWNLLLAQWSESGLPKHGMRDFRPRTEPAGSSIYAGMISISLAFSFVRLANWCKLENSVRIRKGMLGTVVTIALEEGLVALWKGIVPGLHRQCLYGGLRIGLYDPVKIFFVGNDFVGDVPLFKKVLAALITGAIAIAVANPTDLVKVRLQAEGKLPPGVPRRYTGALDAYYTIVRQEGLAALWTGLGPNIARNAIINAAELASYDQIKQTILKISGFTDNLLTHLLAGLGAGFFAVCIGSPVDVGTIAVSMAFLNQHGI